MRSIFSRIVAVFLPFLRCLPVSNSSTGALFGGKGGNGSIYEYFYYPRVYENKPEMLPFPPTVSRSMNFASINPESMNAAAMNFASINLRTAPPCFLHRKAQRDFQFFSGPSQSIPPAALKIAKFA